MFGISDIFFSQLNRLEQDEKNHANDFSVHEINRKHEMTWVCFLPRRTSLDLARRIGILPLSGNLIVYDVPLNLIASNPYDTKKAFYSLVNHFEKKYKNILKTKKIGLWGVSVGVMPAIYIANVCKCEKARFICGTDLLGEGIFATYAARKIKKEVIENGFTANSYDNVLSEINPIKNIQNLPINTIFVLARFDHYVPYCGGRVLFRKSKEYNDKVKKIHFPFFGHVLSILMIGVMNHIRNFFVKLRINKLFVRNSKIFVR